MSEVSGWAPVPSMLSKAAAVLGPGLVLLTVLVPEAGLTPATALVAIHMPGSGLFTMGLPTASPVKTACMRLWLVLTS